MRADDIIKEVKEFGYSVFKLAPETIEYLRALDLSYLEDGFHINNTEHCAAIEDASELNNIVNSIQTECVSKKIAWNTINVARVVKQKSNEKYRTHYDSHLYTLVVPLQTSAEKDVLKGQLYLSPNLRKQPKLDIINFLQKAFAFRWRGEAGYAKLERLDKIKVFDLQFGEAILFNGSRSLHGNLANESHETRITMITHMADPFPNGIGALMRKLRKVTGLRK